MDPIVLDEEADIDPGHHEDEREFRCSPLVDDRELKGHQRDYIPALDPPVLDVDHREQHHDGLDLSHEVRGCAIRWGLP